MLIKKEIVELIVSISHFDEYGYKNYCGKEGDLVGRIMSTFDLVETGYLQGIPADQQSEYVCEVLRLGQGEILIDMWKEICKHNTNYWEEWGLKLKKLLLSLKEKEKMCHNNELKSQQFMNVFEEFNPNLLKLIAELHPDEVKKILDKLMDNNLQSRDPGYVPKPEVHFEKVNDSPRVTVSGDPNNPITKQIGKLFNIDPVSTSEDKKIRDASVTIPRRAKIRKPELKLGNEIVQRIVLFGDTRHEMLFNTATKRITITANQDNLYTGIIKDESEADFIWERYKIGVTIGTGSAAIYAAINELNNL